MKKAGRFVITVFLSVFLSVFCITGTVMSHSRQDLKIVENAYRKLETEYVYQVKQYLKEQGYGRSGVMMTRVVEADGSRAYTVTVHDEELARLSGEEITRLKEALSAMAFEAPDCSFCHIFPACET